MSKRMAQTPNSGMTLDDSEFAKGSERATAQCNQLVEQIRRFASGEAHGYAGREVFVRLTREQAEFIARLRRGLYNEHAQLANGKHVESHNATVLWLIEQAQKVVA